MDFGHGGRLSGSPVAPTWVALPPALNLCELAPEPPIAEGFGLMAALRAGIAVCIADKAGGIDRGNACCKPAAKAMDMVDVAAKCKVLPPPMCPGGQK